MVMVAMVTGSMVMGNMAMESMGAEDMAMEGMDTKKKGKGRRIDLHMHILPGVDDGAETMDDAVEMAEISARSGIGIAAATPHGDFSKGNPKEYLRICSEKLESLRAELIRRKIPLKVVSGWSCLLTKHL